MMVWQRPNLLLLDEPTNHLDLATREALSMALNEFEGTVMLVSHDRALLRASCDEFWLVGRGVVSPFDGDLTTTSATCWTSPNACGRKPGSPPGWPLWWQVHRQILPVLIAAHAAPARVTASSDPKPGANPQAQRKLDAQQRQQLAARLKPVKRALEQTEQRMTALTEEGRAGGALSRRCYPPSWPKPAGARKAWATSRTSSKNNGWPCQARSKPHRPWWRNYPGWLVRALQCSHAHCPATR